MKELEENNCEIRNVINFDLPLWRQSKNLSTYEEAATIDGLKELNLSQTLGGFLNKECKYAWLSHETYLVVIDIRYGRCISYWNFANKITSVSAFPTKSGSVPLLLVGLDNNAIRIKDSVGHLCIFDCCTSNILLNIELPAGVEKACVIHGGANWEEFNEKRADTVLPDNNGLIFVALRNLQHIVIDINRALWKNSIFEGKSFSGKLEFVNIDSPASTKKNKKETIHLAYDLMDMEIERYMGFDRADFEATPLYDENLCSVLLSSIKIGCLITGCLGRVIIWQSDGSIGWLSPLFDENAYVTHIALLEPSDDPRPFYYLWIACQGDTPDSSAVLRMYAMLFNKKCSDKANESCLYFNLESEPSLKFELELEPGERIHNLLPVERDNFRDSADPSSHCGEDSLLLISTNERLLLFDLNRWYKEQMPRTMAECRNPNSVMASYRIKSEEMTRNGIIACSYIPRSLREFPNKGPSSPEELFYPNSLTLEWVELGLDSLVFWIARGVQSELLRDITIAGPIVLVNPTETFRRCILTGLVPFDTIPQDYALDADKIQQREMLLSICLEQRWTSLLTRCAVEWSDGSAAYLYPEFLRWGVQRAAELKLMADRLCVPLFDHSGSNIGEAEVKILRFCGQQLDCLNAVVSKLPNLESDLEKQRRALKRIATYLQVLLWFYDVALLPETQEMDEDVDLPQITLSMKIPYPREKLIELYKKKRASDKSKEVQEKETLFIDNLILNDCLPLKEQWKKEAGSESLNLGGCYPPPSLQSLLRSYLTDCYQDDGKLYEDIDERDVAEVESKHSITIYFLMDLAMLLQGSHPAVDRLIKYPSAFKLSPSLIKITQAFWLLDHEDYDGFFKIMTGPLILQNDIKDWHHKLALGALIRSDQHKLALTYLRILKPPFSSLEDQSIFISLSVEQGLIESAFHARPPQHYSQLLIKFFESCKRNGKLNNILHLSLDHEEEEVFLKFLKDGGFDETRLLYYLQRCRHTEASDLFSMDKPFNSKQSKIHPTALKILGAFNNTLPDITKRFANNYIKVAKDEPLFSNKSCQQHLSIFDSTNVISRPQPHSYPRPMSQCRNQVKEIYEIAVNKTRETCLKADRTGNGPNHVPFLGAPCSTIVYCTRIIGNAVDTVDNNSVLFPQRKVSAEKRMRIITNEDDDNAEGAANRKKRKLSSNTSTELSSGDNDPQLIRRLSMSQVCNTPLVQRKTQISDNGNPNDIIVETPHSILKIRQMIRRHSCSPSLNFENIMSCEKEAMLRRTPTGDARSARQIRFSMDRMSNNDDSVYSTNGSNQEENDSNITTSVKNFKEDSCMEDNFYSPTMSIKSHRDSSILSDTSITKCIREPRPRPGLRRSSVLSQTSSDYLSHKNSLSDSSTMNISSLDTTFEGKSLHAVHKSPRKTAMLSSYYSASILSSNTSIDESILKKPFPFNNNKREEYESQESEEQSDVESDVNVIAENLHNSKESSVETSSVNEEEILEVDLKEQQKELLNYKYNDQHITEDDNEEHEISSTNVNPLQENEISEDEDDNLQGKHGKSVDKSKEEEECDQDDTFQSFSSSQDTTTISELSENFPHKLEDDIGQEEMHPIQRSLNNSYLDYSLTKNLAIEKPYESFEQNHSLTKPLFIDKDGMVKFNNLLCTVDITDDESLDADIIKPQLSSSILLEEEQEKEKQEEINEEAELVLNLSGSEASDGENKIQQSNERSFKGTVAATKEVHSPNKEMECIIKESSEGALISEKETSPLAESHSKSSRSRIASLMSTKSDDFGDTSLGQNAKQQISIRNSDVTSPVIEIMKSDIIKETDYRDANPTSRASVSKEVTNILSTVTQTMTSEIQIEAVQLSKEKNLSKESRQKSLSPVTTPTKAQIPVKQALCELSEEKILNPETNNSSKTIAKRSNRVASKELSKSTTSTIRKRTTRAGSIAKDTSLKEVKNPVRKARTASMASDITEDKEIVDKKKLEQQNSSTSSVLKNTSFSETVMKPEKEVKVKKTVTMRSTRANSTTKDLTILENIIENEEVGKTTEKKTNRSRSKKALSTSKSEQAEKTENLEENRDIEKTLKSKLLRTSSIVNDSSRKTATRKTRASSVIEEEEKSPVARQTRRAASLLKEINFPSEEEIKLTSKRATRASSLAKETKVSVEEEAKSVHKKSKDTNSVTDTLRKRTTRKRGNSLPKEITALESSHLLQQHTRRSKSLIKDVILEESISQLDSPMSKPQNKIPRIIVEDLVTATSSPAANTRSRRSSIQSIPEELEEVLSVPINSRSATKKIAETSKEDIRNRRAASVDSTVAVPTGKRITRSVLAKTAIIEAIPEEVPLVNKKQQQSSRRKRVPSVSSEVPGEIEKEKAKPESRPKRGRKASESQDFHFSLPDEAKEQPLSEEDECPPPVYKFSEPTEPEKFISPVCDDEESSEITTNVLKRDKTDGERTTSARVLRRPRTCFVLPKRTKNKAK